VQKCYIKKNLFYSSFVSSISELKVILVEENAFCVDYEIQFVFAA